MSQQILHWQQHPSYQPEDFIVSDSNRMAWEWVMRWPDWNGAQRLCLVGEKASGKTHLSEVWRGRAGGERVMASQLREEEIPVLLGEGKNLVVDALESLTNESALFHLINESAAKQAYLLLTSAIPIPELKLNLPDLSSRLRASLQAHIGLPDDELLISLAYKLFSDRQVEVSPEAVEYLIKHTERSFEALLRHINRIDRESLSKKKPITTALVKSLIS